MRDTGPGLGDSETDRLSVSCWQHSSMPFGSTGRQLVLPNPSCDRSLRTGSASSMEWIRACRMLRFACCLLAASISAQSPRITPARRAVGQPARMPVHLRTASPSCRRRAGARRRVSDHPRDCGRGHPAMVRASGPEARRLPAERRLWRFRCDSATGDQWHNLYELALPCLERCAELRNCPPSGRLEGAELKPRCQPSRTTAVICVAPRDSA
jgi:hypothetical protein